MPRARAARAPERKGRRAFTFIELLIAVSIFATLAIALYSSFFAGISIWKRSAAGGGVYQDVRFALDDLTRDLKSAAAGGADEDSLFAFSGESERVVFFTSAAAFSGQGAQRRELTRVAYGLDRESGRLFRARAVLAGGFDLDSAEKDTLVEGVEDFSLSYPYDSGDEDDPYIWREEWQNSDMRPPRGVKVSLAIASGNEKGGRLKFDKIIFIPTGVLGKDEI